MFSLKKKGGGGVVEPGRAGGMVVLFNGQYY